MKSVEDGPAVTIKKSYFCCINVLQGETTSFTFLIIAVERNATLMAVLTGN